MIVRIPVVTVVVSLLSGTMSTNAAPARWYRNLTSASSNGPAHRVVRQAFGADPARFGLARVDLAPTERVIPWRDQRIVRIGQEYEGLPVFGRGVAARVDPQGRLRALHNSTAPDLDLLTEPGLTPGEAVEEASFAWGSPLSFSVVTLGVLDDGAHGVLVYRVDGTPRVKRVRTYVDAVSGVVLRRVSLAHHEAYGWVYPENPANTPTLALEELLHLTQDATQLNGRFGSVWRYVRGELSNQNPALGDLTVEQTATLDGTMFDYQPTTDASQPDWLDAFAEVSAYYHTDLIDSYFRDTHGYATARRYEVVVNYGDGELRTYENAFFTPLGTNAYGLFLGQWMDLDSAYDADVIYHEYGHSVVEDLTHMEYMSFMPDEWGMNPAPGAIHEGMADYFSSTLTGDAVLGEYSLGHYSRDLDNENTCPEDIRGEAHDDGEIVGGATWEIRTALGLDLADDIIYGGLAPQPSNASLRDLALGILDAAAALVTATTMTQTQYDEVETILTSRGMLRCGRALALDDGPAPGVHSQGLTELGQMFGRTCEEIREFGAWRSVNFQYRVDVPTNAHTLRFNVGFDPGSGDIRWRAYVRSGQLIRYASAGGWRMQPADYDYLSGEFTTDDGILTFTSDDATPLAAGTTYYLAIEHQNCPTVDTIVSAEIETDTPESDAGVDAGSDAGPSDPNPKNGCGCAHTNTRGLPLAFLLALMVLGWTRRRRSR